MRATHPKAAVTIAPFLALALAVCGPVNASGDSFERNPFGFNPAELDPIRFTRNEDGAPDDLPVTTHQTEFSFKLKPGKFDFSRSGNFGLGLISQSQGAVAVEQRIKGELDLGDSITSLHQGFEYSAGLRIEHDDEHIDGTAYVSSSLLGLSYGRLGRLWYGGIDVNLQQFSDEINGDDQSDIVSLDLTTGRRLGFTGLDATSPLWLLSLQGTFDVQEVDEGNDLSASSDWYLNPSLFWQNRTFTFSAQMQLPVELAPRNGSDVEPDYRLRAVFEKHFK